MNKKEIPQHEVEQLFCTAYAKTMGVGLSRLDLYLMRGLFPATVRNLAEDWVRQRSRGVPLQHLTGTQIFGEHEYYVGPEALIPRLETEVLLREAISRLSSIPRREPFLGLEIGLGSGVLSIELLSYFPSLRMVASEISIPAGNLARRNAERILKDEAARLQIVLARESDHVWEVFVENGRRQAADFLIMNPPYLDSLVAEQEAESEVRKYEPAEALFAPSGHPLFFYQRVAEQPSPWLHPGAFVFAEVPHERATMILNLFIDAGWSARLINDLTQRPRVLIAQWEGKNG